MCGRYSFVPDKQQLADLTRDWGALPPVPFRYNIAPTQKALVWAEGPQVMEWGLVPHWSPDGNNQGLLINARMEGIGEKPSFRDAVLRRRCVVPADSFYEWKKGPFGQKIPYRIFAQNGELLYFAGIWEEWKGIKRSFSIITTPPNAEMALLHQRMPAILPDENARAQWLSTAPLASVLPLLQSAPDGMLRYYRVSEQLNKADFEGPEAHREVPETWTLF